MTDTQPTVPDAAPGADEGLDALTMRLLLDPEARADPYPHYRTLRERSPVHPATFGPLWFCTRYADCHQVLRDPTVVQPPTVLPGDEDTADPESGGFQLFGRTQRRNQDPVVAKSLLRLNPPDHTRLRGLVSRGFTPRRVERLRPAVEAMTDELLDEMEADGDLDVLDTLGFPLPVRVIGELVGVPPADRDRFRSLVRAAATSLEPGITDEQLAAAIEANGEMQTYFAELIEQRRSEPRDDLTSALVEIQREQHAGDGSADDEAPLTEEEMIATLILIFAAGFETTTNLIGNGLLTLLQYPGELERLRRDPGLTDAVVEEILRYQSPVQMDGRRTTAPLEVGGATIPAGEWVLTFLGAANRDPERFDDPETFRIVDRETPPLSFATGIHRCLGASLARLEGRVVFRRLVDRFSEIELLDEPRWRNTFILRGLERLPVAVRA